MATMDEHRLRSRSLVSSTSVKHFNGKKRFSVDANFEAWKQKLTDAASSFKNYFEDKTRSLPKYFNEDDGKVSSCELKDSDDTKSYLQEKNDQTIHAGKQCHNKHAVSTEDECFAFHTEFGAAEILLAIFETLRHLDIDKLEKGNLNEYQEQKEEPTCNIGKNMRCRNVLQEEERRYIYSPHVKKKFLTFATDILPLEEKYIYMKTDIFTKSTIAENDILAGELDVSIQYLIVSERLKVTVENVRTCQKSKESDNLFVSVSMASKKKQKEKGVKLSKLNRDKNINNIIYFNKISIEEVHLLCLEFKVHRESSVFVPKRKKCFAECFIFLDKHDVIGNARISENLIEYN